MPTVLSLGIALHPTAADTSRLDRILADVVNGRDVPGAVARIERGDGSVVWQGAAGSLASDAQWFVASVTKLFTSAVVLQLRAEGKLALDDPVARFVPPDALARTHVLKGIDRSGDITIRQLLAHTSGLPDYFQGKGASGRSLERELLDGRDRGWSRTDALDAARAMTPRFVPGAKGKAYYSDTNYQLLGLAIERIDGRSVDAAIDARVLRPLGLTRTYMYRDPADTRPPDIAGKRGPLRIPQAMASFGPDGGVVSTAPELSRFLRAWFGGELFPRAYVDELAEWNPIFFPFEAGPGHWRFHIPRWASPLKASPDLRGHGGLSGSFAFYEPARDLFIVGTVNSAASAGRPYRLVLRLLDAVAP